MKGVEDEVLQTSLMYGPLSSFPFLKIHTIPPDCVGELIRFSLYSTHQTLNCHPPPETGTRRAVSAEASCCHSLCSSVAQFHTAHITSLGLATSAQTHRTNVTTAGRSVCLFLRMSTRRTGDTGDDTLMASTSVEW